MVTLQFSCRQSSKFDDCLVTLASSPRYCTVYISLIILLPVMVMWLCSRESPSIDDHQCQSTSINVFTEVQVIYYRMAPLWTDVYPWTVRRESNSGF